MTFLIRI